MSQPRGLPSPFDPSASLRAGLAQGEQEGVRFPAHAEVLEACAMSAPLMLRFSKHEPTRNLRSPFDPSASLRAVLAQGERERTCFPAHAEALEASC